MNKFFFTILISSVLFGCKNNQQKSEDIAPLEETVIVDSIKPITIDKGCYVYNENYSLIKLEIIETGELVSGNLTYALAEKDRNTGVFKGQLKEDKLIGTYTFQSEGIDSVREVAFKVDGDKLIEGFGELTVEGNRTSFKDVNSLNFTSTMPLTKVDCDECLFINGKAESALKQACIELSSIEIKLNPLLDGGMTSGDFAYVLFNEDQTKAEIFLPQQDTGIVLNKTNTGNWESGEYKLIGWKGYVIQQNGKAVFGG